VENNLQDKANKFYGKNIFVDEEILNLVHMPQNNAFLYTKDNIDAALKLVLRAVDFTKNSESASELIPFAIELYLDPEGELNFEVHWTRDMTETILLRRFRNHDYKREHIVCTMYKNLGESYKGGGIALRKVGVCGVLYELLVTAKRGKSVALTKKYVELDRISEEMREKLLDHIGQLTQQVDTRDEHMRRAPFKRRLSGLHIVGTE